MPDSISTWGVLKVPAETITSREACARRASPRMRYSTPVAAPSSMTMRVTRACAANVVATSSAPMARLKAVGRGLWMRELGFIGLSPAVVFGL